MPWARLDDGLNDDAKLGALSDGAFRLWVAGLVYCQKNLTDGLIPGGEVEFFRVRQRNRVPLVAELCASLVPFKGPLWHKVDGGYQMHDYLHHNDSRDRVIAERTKTEERKQRFKDRRRLGGVLSSVSNCVRNAVLDAFSSPPETHPERTSTYHVPRTDEKQERWSAPLPPVDAVENRLVLALRRARSSETADGLPSLRVVAAVARHVLKQHPTEQDEGELAELVKVTCARANLTYNSSVVGTALAMARAQLRKRRKEAA